MGEYLREAVREDMEMLFQWANEPEVRKNSFSTQQISYEEHRQWFLKLLKDTSRKQYIYMADQVPVGQIRAAIYEKKAEISYSISREWRGQGYGKKMLALFQKQLLKDEPGVSILTAKVKKGNVSSEKAFIKAGYQARYTVFELRQDWQCYTHGR